MFWLKVRARWSEQGKVEEQQPPTHIVWKINEYQPPRSPEQQQWVDKILQGVGDNPAEPVRWEGDQGYAEDDADEAPRRRRY